FGDLDCARAIERAVSELVGVDEVRASIDTGRVLVVLRADDLGTRASVLAVLARSENAAAPHPPSLRRSIRSVAKTTRAALRGARGLVSLQSRAGGAATPVETDPGWHARDTADVARALAADPERGLSSVEARTRRNRYGPNVLAGVAPRTRRELIVDQVL